jgi:hypothetical protein
MIFMRVCAFCGDETLGDVRPMAHIDQSWAHRTAQRAHTPREIILIPSSLLQPPVPHVINDCICSITANKIGSPAIITESLPNT